MQPTWGWTPAPPEPWRDNRHFVRIAAAVWSLTAIAAALLGVQEWSRLDDEIRGGDDFGLGFGFAGSAARGFSGIVALGGLVLGVIATWRLAKAQELLGRPGARWGPGWAIASRVIPLANAVLPALQLDELVRGTRTDVAPGDYSWRTGRRNPVAIGILVTTVASSVIAFVGAIVLAVAAVRDIDETVAQQREQLADAIADARPWMLAASVLATIATCVNAWLLVRIADRQQVLHETHPAPAAPPPPAYGPAYGYGWGATQQAPGWYADPSGRFEWRWWDGTAWRAEVSRDGITAHDPPPGWPGHPTS